MAGHWISQRGGWRAFKSQDLHAMYGEFIGTAVKLMTYDRFGMAGVQATVTNLSKDNSSDGTSIQGSDAARLMSIFNPNVSLALCAIGAITPVRFVLCAIAQLVGGIVAAAILDGLTPGPLSVACQLGFGTSRTQGLFIEMFCTAALVLSVLMLAAEKSKLTPLAPLGFGVMLWAVELFSVEYTGGAINTARAFGPAVLTGFKDYHWIYWLGPTLGSMLATGFYFLLKYIKYWYISRHIGSEINPGQDSDDPKDAPLSDLPNESQSRLNSHSMA
ncbi:hypothetical protein QFC21_004957 [Naganishia friedmannii]|uniref:Uncharacterized protein n=1 Tax=Naganishia friedmannii TaxID=89922 RepID=A0ACC2VDT7_9TREE|nr:hypothetical protein QFC21_004957 [Naganishia friedmannii]